MAITFDSALGIHDDALKFRSQRSSVLANNLANLDTPNYKARDIDFQAALKRAEEETQRMKLATTDGAHIEKAGLADMDDSLLYRTPTQPSIDGNTVEEHVEHAKFMENTLDFQSSFTFLNSKFKGLNTALRGE